MKRLFTRVAAVAALVLFLAACGNPADGDRLTVRLTPSGTLGYEVQGGNLTIENRSVVFRNAPGEPQALIHGVATVYRNAFGVVIEEFLSDPSSVSIVVPAGYVCAEPDPVTGCDPLASGNRVGWGQESVLDDAQTQLLPAQVAAAHAVAPLGTSGWTADVTFYGTNARGPIEITKTFYIVAPN